MNNLDKLGKNVRVNNDRDKIATYFVGVSRDKLKEFIKDYNLVIEEFLTDKEFTRLYGVSSNKIISYGYLKNITFLYMETLISNCIAPIHASDDATDKYKKDKRRSFRCCSKRGNVDEYHKDPTTAGHIVHQDIKSAWNCINEVLRKPEALIIVEI